MEAIPDGAARHPCSAPGPSPAYVSLLPEQRRSHVWRSPASRSPAPSSSPTAAASRRPCSSPP
ncbi:MAG: hypothetical protein MZV64_18785 [Ignavibacteriales bacterium]|nr:hypothetical protein [Ignavibacteriales bacterium]